MAMRKWIGATAVFAAAAAGAFALVTYAKGSSAYRTVTADEAEELIDAGGMTVVDVRKPVEYEERHIPGALNVSVENIGSTPPAALPDLDAPLILYCRTGKRSRKASRKLSRLGYTNVIDMGGILEWTGDIVTGSEPYRTKPKSAPTAHTDGATAAGKTA